MIDTIFRYGINHFCVKVATFCALKDVDRSVAFFLSCNLYFNLQVLFDIFVLLL